MMQSARKLILVDESDREYKRLQRPTNAVAKTKHSLEVSNTLRDSTLADDQKVREYVAALHRYLNLRKQVTVEPTVQVNPITVAPPPSPPHHHHLHHRGLPYDRHRRRFGDAAGIAESSVERGLPFDMETAYSDLRSAGSFGRLNNLRRYAGATTRSAREYLAKRDSYTLHKPRRLRFPRRKTYSKGIADLLSDRFGGCVRSFVTQRRIEIFC